MPEFRAVRTIIDTVRRGLKSAPLHGPTGDGPGRFLDRRFSGEAGELFYKLYIPARLRAPRPPLLIMLHGCGQTPEDFATGTRMNELADRHGFLVVYPAQSAAANAFTCWNWFLGKDQSRERGEPALIAGATREVAQEYAVDPARIFIAGLSAGGAMAVVLGATYPELFSAVGVHSGLPYRAAHDSLSAMAVMRSAGAATPGVATPGGSTLAAASAEHATPTIVFHGDRDPTVHVDNGSAIVDRAVSNAERVCGTLRKTTCEGRSGDGRSFTMTAYRAPAAARPRDAKRTPQTGALQPAAFVEHWVLHGAGHAWSGGSSGGSYTDRSGPDASTEMVRFFFDRA